MTRVGTLTFKAVAILLKLAMWSERLLSLKLALAILSFLVLGVSCEERKTSPNKDLSLSYYDSLSIPTYNISVVKVKRELRRMVGNDGDSTLSDFYTRKYYNNDGPLVWISRKGVSERADSLLARLSEVRRIGFNPRQFRISDISQDLKRAHELRFDAAHPATKVLARLEYNLTKALFRFSSGQRYGYTIPSNLLNRLDLVDSHDSSAKVYRQLYALASQRPSKKFYEDAVWHARHGGLSLFLDSCEPRSPLYKKLLDELNCNSEKPFSRALLLVNLERSRWRLKDYPWDHDKYVLVNLPSLHLTANGKDSVLTLRIGCGAAKTKTPLLEGFINRIDINPQWIMPRSIVKKSIIHRLGSVGWFASKHYFIRDRASGKIISPTAASPEALLNGSQLAIQEGGQGNALGRIIFRFNNGLSIYLHDTSSKEIFDKSDRDVSHGCIRVDKPFKLVTFLLGDNRKIISKIWYSINADVSCLGKNKDELTIEQQAVADTLRRDMLIGKASVEPSVPVYLWYYTLYPDANGTLRSYADLYGYDEIIFKYLKNYL